MAELDPETFKGPDEEIIFEKEDNETDLACVDDNKEGGNHSEPLDTTSSDQDDMAERLRLLEQLVHKVLANGMKKRLEDAKKKTIKGSDLFKKVEELEGFDGSLETFEDGLEKIEQEAEEIDDDDKYPPDCYSLIALNAPNMANGQLRFFLFGVLVFLCQIAFPLLLGTSVVKSNAGEATLPEDFDAANLLNFLAVILLPTGLPINRITQGLAMFVFIFYPETCFHDIVGAVRYFPWKSGGSAVESWMRVACVMKGLQGLLSAVAAWLLIMTSETVVDIILNFAAMSFVSGLDESAFEFAKSGIFGEKLQEEAQKVAGEVFPAYKLSVSMKKDKPLHKWYFNVLVSSAAVFTLFATIVFLVQASENQWFTHTLRIQFTGDQFKSYSGCYGVGSYSDRRLAYCGKGKKGDEDFPSSIGYCLDERRWILFEGSDTEIDPCKAKDFSKELGRSSKTDSFDVLSALEKLWLSSSGAPLEFYVFDTVDNVSNLYCEKGIGDGICDTEFNKHCYQYDGGDCCAATCKGPNCGSGLLDKVFGEVSEGDGFENCEDPEMEPITIRLNNFEASNNGTAKYEDYFYECCESDPAVKQQKLSCTNATDRAQVERYFDCYKEEGWREATPSKTYFSLYCNGANVMTVYIDDSMNGGHQVAKVADGANCTVKVRNSIDGGDIIWFVNYTVSHGYGYGYVEDDSQPKILTSFSKQQNLVEFDLLPSCYLKTLKDVLDVSTIYQKEQSSFHKAVWWLNKDRLATSACANRQFLERFYLVSLYHELGEPEHWNITREGHCTWSFVFCERGRVSKLDLKGKFINNATAVNNIISGFGALKSLDFSYNDLVEMPEAIFNQDLLVELTFSGNDGIGKVPKEIGNLVNLEYLDFNSNGIYELPTEFGKLVSLTYLDLGHNLLENDSVAPILGFLQKLTKLRLHNNELSEFPKEVGNLVKLKHLELRKNTNLSQLPPEIGKLTELEFIGLTETGVKCADLPASIANAECYD